MTPVGTANGSDLRGMPRSLQPVVDGSADLAALNRRIAGPGVARDQQDNPVAGGDRPLQPAVDRRPCPVEIEAVKVDNAVGLDGAGLKPPVPGPVESRR